MPGLTHLNRRPIALQMIKLGDRAAHRLDLVPQGRARLRINVIPREPFFTQDTSLSFVTNYDLVALFHLVPNADCISEETTVNLR